MAQEEIQFRKAEITDLADIWKIIQEAIARRKADGSMQWQDGYPSIETIQNDMDKKVGYVLTSDKRVVAYAAVINDIEPAYELIEGSWLTKGPYIVVHRVAVADARIGKGLAKTIFLKIEQLTKAMGLSSIKVDTNFDNPAMLHILEKLEYHFCGTVYFRGSARLAYEKIIL